jgi:hypothetical protein
VKRQIVYLMSGPAHLPYLVCSLWTLRRWWTGAVSVYAWPESWEYVRRIAGDGRLEIQHFHREPAYRGKKNSQFLDKIRLMQQLDECDENMYLDADTTVHREIYPLFSQVAERGFVATQFNDWMSDRRIITNRVERLKQFPFIDQGLVDEVLRGGWPSVNGGVFACRPDSPVLPLWERWTAEAISVFIADECVLHLMQPRFYEAGRIATLMGGHFNCSPRFQPANLPDEDVRIWHYHGDSNVRPGKAPKGCEIWRSIYKECVEKNIGGIAEWRGEVKNKYLDRLEKLDGVSQQE